MVEKAIGHLSKKKVLIIIGARFGRCSFNIFFFSLVLVAHASRRLNRRVMAAQPSPAAPLGILGHFLFICLDTHHVASFRGVIGGQSVKQDTSDTRYRTSAEEAAMVLTGADVAPWSSNTQGVGISQVVLPARADRSALFGPQALSGPGFDDPATCIACFVHAGYFETTLSTAATLT